MKVETLSSWSAQRTSAASKRDSARIPRHPANLEGFGHASFRVFAPRGDGRHEAEDAGASARDGYGPEIVGSEVFDARQGQEYLEGFNGRESRHALQDGRIA